MTRFISLDHAYEDAWNALPHSTPDEWFQQCFGTADFLDIALRAAGHEAMTHFTNGDPNYQLAIANFVPDVIISTAASRWGAYEGSPLAEMRRFNPKLKLVLFCSHRVDDYVLQGCDVIFSSFPWMMDHCKSLGVRCEYLPLAFGRPVLRRLGDEPIERNIPVAFVGGLGSRIWDKGTQEMAAIAEAVPAFRWWGYKIGELPTSLERSYMGQAWGISYYRLLHRIQILLNRHGEIARGFANNMREFEGPGCGCCLISDCHGDTMCGIVPDSLEDKIAMLRRALDGGWQNVIEAGRAAQRLILEKHCYENRVGPFLNTVENL